MQPPLPWLVQQQPLTRSHILYKASLPTQGAASLPCSPASYSHWCSLPLRKTVLPTCVRTHHTPALFLPFAFLEHWTTSLSYRQGAWRRTIFHDGFYYCSVQLSSVTQSCPTLFDPMDSSTPGFPVHHQFLELAQTHIYQVSDAIQPSHSLLSPSPPAFNLSQHQGFFFLMSWLFATDGQSIGASASASVFPMNIQDRFPLGLTGWSSLQSKGFSRVFSNNTIQSINSSALSFPYGPILTSIHNYWKNHSFVYTDIHQQSNISVF